MEYRRHYQAGAHYFFTVVTEKRRPILISNIEKLRDAFKHCMLKHPFQIDAIIVLPDHLHTIWKLPENDTDYSKRWMVIKRKFSSGLDSYPVTDSKSKKREKGIWQRRFWEHCIRNEEDWRKHVDYIHFNAVKHGLVDSPENWEFSSYQKSVEKGWYLDKDLSDAKNLDTVGE